MHTSGFSGQYCPVRTQFVHPISLNQASFVLNSHGSFEPEVDNVKDLQPLILSTHDMSDLNSAEVGTPKVTNVPTKEALYQLSTIIQNTDSEFQNYNSSELRNFVDHYMLTASGLYISKMINGFNWEFEIIFEKSPATQRLRRQLRCKHKNCNKVFKKAWNLFDHMRIHTGTKPFLCNVCGKSFAQNGNLTKHLKLHEKKDRKVHDCQFCGKTYTEKFNLRVHLKQKHSNLTHCHFE